MGFLVIVDWYAGFRRPKIWNGLKFYDFFAIFVGNWPKTFLKSAFFGVKLGYFLSVNG